MTHEPATFPYTLPGYCPVCEKGTNFVATEPYFRKSLICEKCKSVPRERALALILNEERPDWRDLIIHESSPAKRGISLKFAAEGRHYIASHYFPGQVLGTMINGYRNEDLEAQTFENESIDIVITLDVHEHIFNPDAAYREIYRVLKPGGVYIHTYPIQRSLVPSITRRAILKSDKTVQHLLEPQYHGNPIDNAGALVTIDYGYDIHKTVADWANFDVRVIRFCDRTHGILGEFTDVVLCRKPNSPGP
jgi:SAM-dependent methyltransferase